LSEERKLDAKELGKIGKMLDEGSLEKVTFALDLLESLGAEDADYLKLFSRSRTTKLLKGRVCEGPILNTNTNMNGEMLNLMAERLFPFSDAYSALDDSVKKLTANQIMGLMMDLTELSDAAAEILSKHADAKFNNQKDRVSYGCDFRNLASLSDKAASFFSKCEGYFNLDGLSDLSHSAAESLSQTPGSLNLNGLTELSDAAAKSLSRHEGVLNLNGLTELSDAAAESFSKHKGELSFAGLTSLSDAAAESLSRHTGYLSLRGLTELSQVSVESLSRHKNHQSFDFNIELLKRVRACARKKYRSPLPS
tara:strand:- start:132 stop:1058 length:927 start_codon:yes stop_codon:yes gene_type:complete